MSIRIRTRRYDLDRPVSLAGGNGAPPYQEVKGLYEQMEPARAGNVHSDVLVPLLQSLITGILGGSLLTLLALAFLTQNTEHALYAFGFSFVLITAVVWMGLLDDHKRLLWRVERLVGKDFDGDGVIGDPDRLVVEIHRPGTYEDRTEFIHLGVGRDRFIEFVRGILSGEPISVARWTGIGKPFRRGEFESLRSTLMERGILRWRDSKNHGVEITAEGREILESLIRDLE